MKGPKLEIDVPDGADREEKAVRSEVHKQVSAAEYRGLRNRERRQ